MERFEEWFTYLINHLDVADELYIELDRCERGIYQKVSPTYQATIKNIFDYAVNELNISSIDQENVIGMINSGSADTIVMGLYYLLAIVNNQ